MSGTKATIWAGDGGVALADELFDDRFDDRNRRLLETLTSMTEGVNAFVSRPGATVRVISRASGGEWRRYAQRVGETFTETNQLTETLRRGLPGLDHGPGWRSQRAAVAALAHFEAEDAVVVEAGDDGPVTVVTFRRTDDGLVVVGGGTTFPSAPSGELGAASLPSGEEAGWAAQYALASIAVQETRTLSHEVPPDTWHGPRSRGGRRTISKEGQVRSTAPTWLAEDLRYLTERVPLRHPFPQLGSGVEDGPRRWSTELKVWIDRGGTLEVYDHGDPEQRDAAELALLTIGTDVNLLAANPLPDRPGVRTIVATVAGRPRALITAGRNANGDLHVLRCFGQGDPGAGRAAALAMLEAARRTGGAISFSPIAAREFAGTEEHSLSSAQVANETYWVRRHLEDLDKPTVTKLDGLLGVLDGVPGEPPVGADALAASMQRFREAGGDVLFLKPSEPAFMAMQEQVSETLWVAAVSADGAVHRGTSDMWRALNSKTSDREGEQMVAVAVLDGAPVAAVGVNVATGATELGTFGAVPEADDALVAAVVEATYRRTSLLQPVTMFAREGEVRPEQLAAVGLQVTGARALDDDRRFEVRLPEVWRQAVIAAEERTGWPGGRRLDQIAEVLTDFQDANGAVVRLDHADAADRELAEETVRAVLDKNPVRQPEEPVPPVNGNRVTIVAQSDAHGPAYLTFDETPAGQLEVVDVATTGYDFTAREATRYWFCEQLAARGQDAVLNERLTKVERLRGTWTADQSRYHLTGMRNRLGDRPTELLHPPAMEPPEPGDAADQGPAPRPRSAGQDNRRRGPMER
ncbi:hypothetical protein AB0E69_02525 [Kribbella sp. NPDC026611]|uniref:hypothetical protein n=1 Tax=Kribbella sp. NPDC026611 TaxID=3154911 RepID=UPI0033D973EC